MNYCNTYTYTYIVIDKQLANYINGLIIIYLFII